MRSDERLLIQVAIAIAGVLTMVASTGGGSSGPSCAFIIPNAPCPPSGGGGPLLPPAPQPPAVSITPVRQILQVGMPVTFQAHTANLSDPTYSWCRAPSPVAACDPLPGIYGSTYTIPSVDMSDDGAWFRVTATGAQGTAMSNFSELYVSSMPPVVVEDGEFLDSDWAVASVASPVEGAPTFSTTRVATGGNPGAYLSETYNIPGTAGTTVIFHSKLSANYYPTSQGAVYLIDLTLDCRSTAPLTWITVSPMFEQGGRRFANEDPHRFPGDYYCTNTWRSTGGGMSWILVAGPACGSGESCPDFSASAAPLRFGFMVAERSLSPGAAQQVTNSYDNWKVSVWRR